MKIFLRSSEEIAEHTLAFRFEPERPLHFSAGQFGDFTLSGAQETDARGNTRAFSFANAPGQTEILIATRMRESAFKHELRRLPTGAALELMGPMGNFTLPPDGGRPAVFLAGGIGITPVRSIVEEAVQRRLPQEIVVFHANRTLAASAFLDDFRRWQRDYPRLRYIPTLSQEPAPGPEFQHGRIDAAMLRRHLANPTRSIYYVVGPPAMVSTIKGLLVEIGVPASQIRYENFSGY